jgi:glutamyl/glutaminyl-tRNA synthetase
LLGWSHPHQSELFNVDDLGTLFTLDRFIKSPASFDYDKLLFFNREHMKNLSIDELHQFALPFIKNRSFIRDIDWQKRFLQLIREKISLPTEIDPFIADIFNTDIVMTPELSEIFAWESTCKIASFFRNKVDSFSEFYPLQNFNQDLQEIKIAFNIKGKFLFKGARAVLTFHDHGPDLPTLISLTPISILKERLNAKTY